MNQRTFLYQLQLLDIELDKKERRMQEIKNILSFSEDIKKIEKDISLVDTEKKNQSHELRKIADEAELIQAKIKKSEQTLYDGSIRNPKELQSVNTEINSLKNRLSFLDEQQLEIMYIIEGVESQLSILQNSLNDLIKSKNEKNKNLLDEAENIDKNIQKIKTEKNPILSQISNEFLTMYEKLRKTKNNIAVSMIVDNACSVCGNGLPPMEVQKAKSSIDEIFCSVCKRFLYCG